MKLYSKVEKAKFSVGAVLLEPPPTSAIYIQTAQAELTVTGAVR